MPYKSENRILPPRISLYTFLFILTAPCLFTACSSGFTLPVGDSQMTVDQISRTQKLSVEHVPYLIEGLKSDDHAVISDALWGINLLVSKAHYNIYTKSDTTPALQDTIPALIETLDIKDNQIRKAAARALGNMGSKSKNAIPKLIDIIANKRVDTSARASSIKALGQIGPESVEAMPLLISFSSSRSHRIRYVTSFALGAIGFNNSDAVPALLILLEDKEYGVVINAIQSLANIQFQPELCINKLVPLLSHSKPQVQKAALHGLAAFVVDSDRVFPEIRRFVTNLDTQNPNYSYLKSSAWGAIRSTSYFTDAGLPLLLEQVNAGGGNISNQMLYILPDYGPRAREAINPLLDLYEESTLERKKKIENTLRHICDEKNPAVLLIMLTHLGMEEEDITKSVESEQYLQIALEKFARPTGRYVLKEIPSHIIRVYDFDDHAYYEYLREYLLKRRFLRGESALALYEFDSDDSEIVTSLIYQLESSYESYLKSGGVYSHDYSSGYQIIQPFMKILQEIGPDAAEAIPVLERFQDEPNWVLRKSAEKALRAIKN